MRQGQGYYCRAAGSTKKRRKGKNHAIGKSYHFKCRAILFYDSNLHILCCTVVDMKYFEEMKRKYKRTFIEYEKLVVVAYSPLTWGERNEKKGKLPLTRG